MSIIENIKVDINKEDIRIYKLQKLFKAGKITEDDLSKEDVDKLKKLYNNQIKQLKKSIEEYKNKILTIRKGL